MLVLVFAILFQVGVFRGATSLIATHLDATDTDAASTNAGLSGLGYSSPITNTVATQLLNAYTDNISQNGSYSNSEGAKAAEQIASSILPQVSYTRVSSSDVHTDPDISKERVLAYRADLRVALEPLLLNKDMELEIFGRFVESGETAYLDALRNAAVNYRKAAANAAALKVPVDAAVYHAAILNAMNEFAATLDALATNAADPFASAAYLKTYNQAQADILASFGGIGAYAARKTI